MFLFSKMALLYSSTLCGIIQQTDLL